MPIPTAITAPTMGLMPSTAAIPALNTFTSLPDTPLPTLTQTTDTDASPMHETQGLASPSLQLPSQPVSPSTTSPSMPVGLFMGDATLPIPENIANKILKLEFVDMTELCPESWLFESEIQEKPLSSLLRSVSNQLLTSLSGHSVLHHTHQSWRENSRYVPYTSWPTCRLLLAVIASSKAMGGLSMTHHIGAGQPSKRP